MIYDVQFSLDAAAELIRIAAAVGSAVLVLNAVDNIRRKLENDPADQGVFCQKDCTTSTKILCVRSS